MKWVRDNSGRFRQRPYYLPNELEQVCEDAICKFLRTRHGAVNFPVATTDLTVMIEQAVDDLDNGCDLEEGVDGLTDFFPGKKPQVKIASRLQELYLENRLRTTLMHEYGHVILHGFLFTIKDDLKKLFNGKPKDTRNTCRRDTMEGGSRDWMEWQAGFACGALLMPQTALTRVVRAFREAEDLRYADIGVNSEAGQRLIARVMEEFLVSKDAARVRLERVVCGRGRNPTLRLSTFSAAGEVAWDSWFKEARTFSPCSRNSPCLIPRFGVYHRGLREPHLSFRRRELPAALSPVRP